MTRDSAHKVEKGNLPSGMDSRPMIREVIVVEGKDDVAAVKRACHAHTITTSGLGISRETIEEIRVAQRVCGVIVLTDPDVPGAKIRHIINQAVPGCKQAYLYCDPKEKGKPVGVEYAKPAEIIAALTAAKAISYHGRSQNYTLLDMVELGLTGGSGAKGKRDGIARILGLGQTNAKQFIHRLNDYGISRRDFLAAYLELTRENGE